MAKRVRGSRSAHRPGGQGPGRTGRTSNDPAADAQAAYGSEPVDELVTDASYVEVEVDEEAAAAVAQTSRPVTPAEPVPSRRRAGRKAKQRPDDLAARVAAENVWIREDLRRIAVISLVLLAGLAVAWVLFGMLDLLGLY